MQNNCPNFFCMLTALGNKEDKSPLIVQLRLELSKRITKICLVWIWLERSSR